MADKDYIVQLTVDDSGTTKNIDKVATSLDSVSSATKSVKAQVRELQKQLSETDPNSVKFQELSKQAGALKDKLNDASEAVRANAGPAFASLGNNFGLLKGRLSELDFEGVGQSFKAIAGNIKDVKFNDLISGVKSFGSSIGAVGKALLTNPLFLILTGITLIVANFGKIATLFDGVTDQQQEQLVLQQKTAAASKEQLDNISAQENILKVNGATEAEILKLKEAALDTAILEQQAVIQTQQVILDGQIKAAERNKGIVVGILEFLTAPLKVIAKTADSIASVFGKDLGAEKGLSNLLDSGAALIFDPAQIKQEGEAALAEQNKALIALQNQRAGFTLQERAAAQKNAEAKAAELLAIQQQVAKSNEEVFKLQQDLNTLLAKDRADAKTKQLQADKDFLDAQAAQELQALADQEQLRKELRTVTQETEIADADAKYSALRDLAHGNAELEKQLADENGKAVADIQKKYLKAEYDAALANANAKLNIAGGLINGLQAINDGFTAKNRKQAKVQFGITKGLGIAEATVNTFKGVSQALGSYPPPYSFIFAALAGAAGLLQIRKIAKTKFDDGGSSAGASVDTGGGSASVPSQSTGGAPQAFNPIDFSFLGNRAQQPVQAFVISGQATTAMEQEKKTERAARLG